MSLRGRKRAGRRAKRGTPAPWDAIARCTTFAVRDQPGMIVELKVVATRRESRVRGEGEKSPYTPLADHS